MRRPIWYSQENAHRHYVEATKLYHHENPPKLEEAVAEYTKSIECCPTPDAYFQRACIYKEDLGKWQDARDDFTQSIRSAIKFGDKNTIAEGYHERAYCYFHLGQYKPAISDWSELAGAYQFVVSLNQPQAWHFFRGVAHLLDGRIDGACADMNNSVDYALDANQLFPSVFWVRSLCRFRLDNKDRAKIDLAFAKQIKTFNTLEDKWFDKYRRRIKLKRGEKLIYGAKL